MRSDVMVRVSCGARVIGLGLVMVRAGMGWTAGGIRARLCCPQSAREGRGGSYGGWWKRNEGSATQGQGAQCLRGAEAVTPRPEARGAGRRTAGTMADHRRRSRHCGAAVQRATGRVQSRPCGPRDLSRYGEAETTAPRSRSSGRRTCDADVFQHFTVSVKRAERASPRSGEPPPALPDCPKTARPLSIVAGLGIQVNG